MCILEPGVTLAYSVNFWEISARLKKYVFVSDGY